MKDTDTMARSSYLFVDQGRSPMTTFSKVNIIGTIALSFLLAVPGAAFAGKSGGKNAGSSGPQESNHFDYGKTEYTYKSQKTGGNSRPSTKTITHRKAGKEQQ